MICGDCDAVKEASYDESLRPSGSSWDQVDKDARPTDRSSQCEIHSLSDGLRRRLWLWPGARRVYGEMRATGIKPAPPQRSAPAVK